MKKIFSFALALIALLTLSSTGLYPNSSADGDKSTIYCGVAFYNQENLFDTIHDEHKNDYDFLPNGSYHWNSLKYQHKVHNMASVLSKLCCSRVKGGAAFIGLAEVENKRVLDDLIADPALAEKGMRYIHYEGADKRGIDVACLYNPRMFKPSNSELIPARGYEQFSGGHITRGILHVEGNLLKDHVHFLVNHWPSRGAGSESREFLGRLAREIIDSIRGVDANAKIILMGDLNDDPDNKSITEALGAKLNIKEVGVNDMYDPWNVTLRKQGQGTLLYDGMWNLFDQIIVSGNFIGDDRSSFKFFKNEIYMPDEIITKTGKYKGSPLRTTAGGVWQDGYSDHFPTQIYLVKEITKK